MTLNYDPEVWGPHYWFVIFSIAINYPKTPNNTAKKKVYDFIMNLPFFIPNDKIGNDFSKMLDEYPITPYLDSREMLLRWVNFIHNRINLKLGKNEKDTTTALNDYYKKYEPKEKSKHKISKRNKIILYLSLFLLLLLLIIFVYYFENK
mgnify:CR=1 FL=1|jgi:hypothetical protein